jgi:hypothetical protein
MLWSAFVIGALGSFHCIGMCGPIALSMPLGGQHGLHGLFRSLVYNSGRILTYAILGLIVGFLGERIAFGGFQQGLSITVGILMIAVMVLPARLTRRIDPTSAIAMQIIRIKGRFQKVFRSRSIVAPFAIGSMNGLLPCGLVYVALAGALAVGTAWQSAEYMALFGAGTLPMMLGVYLAGDLISVQWRAQVRKLLPVVYIFMGVLFILRGMNLGIPYLSPELDATTGAVQQCHTP